MDNPAKGRRRTRWTRRYVRSTLTGYAFLFPALIGFLVFQIYPLGADLYNSLFRWTIVSPRVWQGLSNYQDIFTKDVAFRRSIVATMSFVLCVPISVVVGLLAGVVLNNQRLKGLPIFRTIVFTPFVTAPVAVAVIFLFIFNPTRVGLVNVGLKMMGLKTVNWFRTGTLAMFVLWVAYIWVRLGFNMIFVLAGLQTISSEYYESAALDGASPFQQFRYITLPLITPTLFFLLVIGLITAFQEFNLPFLMTNGGPRDSTALINFYIYRLAFEYNRMGYASAVAAVTFVILLVLTVVQWRLQSRWVFYTD